MSSDSKAFDAAMQSLTDYGNLKVHGKDVTEDVKEAITGTTVLRTIASVPTLSVSLNDPLRVFAKSGVFGRRTTCRAGDYTYELAQFNKSGPTLSLTFEDQVVAELREHDSPIKVAPGKLTHVEFARRLVGEVNWIEFHTVDNPSKYKVVKSKAPLMRGDPSKKGAAARQSTWDCLTSLAQARGWRVFPLGVNQLWYVPDEYLLSLPVRMTLQEGKGGIDAIDYDWDKGKRIATATITARVKQWGLPPSLHVAVADTGPADSDKWLVQDISRALTSTAATVTLTKAQPILPEPKGSTASGKSSSGSSADKGGGPAPKVTETARATDFTNMALSQRGKPYVFGAVDSPSQKDPSSFDCSSLVQWAAARVGVTLPRTAEAQFEHCNNLGTSCSPAHAIHTRGSLLFEAGSDPSGTFSIGHVAISLGDGKTIEARGSAYGTNEFGAAGRDWSHAALIPEMVY